MEWTLEENNYPALKILMYHHLTFQPTNETLDALPI